MTDMEIVTEYTSRWLIMLRGHSILLIPEVTLKCRIDVGFTPKTAKSRLKQELRDRGWVPEDAEPMSVPGRTGELHAAIIDYEKVYPEDRFYSLYFRSFDGFPRRDKYSHRTKEALPGYDVRTRSPSSSGKGQGVTDRWRKRARRRQNQRS